MRSRRTTLQRSFDAEAVRRQVATSTGDVSIGGPTVATHAFRAGLVEQVRALVAPVTVGAGLPAFPTAARLSLRLLERRGFPASGMVYQRYAVTA